MIRNNKEHLSFDEAASRLAYDPETGVLHWRPVPAITNQQKMWNTTFAGKIAGTIGKDGYRRLRINGKGFAAHRVAWLIHFGLWPDEEIDHKNRNKDDNRIENIREADHSLNMANRQYAASGAKGVYWEAGRWRARGPSATGKANLGRFDTIEEARAAYVAFVGAENA